MGRTREQIDDILDKDKKEKAQESRRTRFKEAMDKLRSGSTREGEEKEKDENPMEESRKRRRY